MTALYFLGMLFPVLITTEIDLVEMLNYNVQTVCLCLDKPRKVTYHI